MNSSKKRKGAKTENYNVKTPNTIVDKIARENRSSVIVRLVASIALPILLGINLIDTVGGVENIKNIQGLSQVALLVATVLCSLFAVYSLVMTVWALMLQDRHKIK